MERELPFKTTKVYTKLVQAKDKRIVCLYGGSSSSKSISALQYITIIALFAKPPSTLVFTIIGESYPVLKRSVIRDWQRIIMKDLFDPDRFNNIAAVYKFPSGAIFQFIPADDERRFFAMRHDYVLIDEAYNVTKGIFDQVEIRTRKQLILTWNPVAPFWAKTLEDERTDVAVIHSTYKDNPFIEQSIINALEMRAGIDENFYRVFVLGEYGTLEGLIFQQNVNWFKVDSMPEDYKRRVFVVDYGFSSDPTAIADLRYSDGQFWVNEIEYDTGLFNSDIFRILKSSGAGVHQVVADSAEPKSNAELTRLGLRMVPSIKGADSVSYGIRTMKEFRINVTTRSVNIIKEFRNYSWQKNRQGEWLTRPIDDYDHMIDAIRYGITHVRGKPNYGKYAVS